MHCIAQMYRIALLFATILLCLEGSGHVTRRTDNRIPGTSPAPVNPLFPAQAETALLQATLRRFPRAVGPHVELPTYSDSDPPSEKFRIYHSCLRAKSSHGREIPQAAKLRQEGQEVELACNVCLRPDHDPSRYEIEWRRFQQRVGEESAVPQDPRRFALTSSKSLMIKNIDVMDAGQYACLLGGQPQIIYQVDVLFKERRRVVFENDTESTVEPEIYLSDYNLRLVTTWSSWSTCSKCGEEGLRRMVGLCTVKKIVLADPVSPVDIPSLAYYPEGVPCRSTLLPRSVANIPYIRDRQSETLMGPCVAACPTVAEVRQVTDEYGKVLKEVEVQYYSINEMPKLPHTPRRDVMYKDAGKRLILKCPTESHNKKKEEMIRWQNGTILINPLTIRRATLGRVRIDHLYRLLIRRLKVTDTAAFNCWVGGTHIATFKVVVTKPMNKNIKTYISFAGLGITALSVFLIAFSICFKNPKRSAK